MTHILYIYCICVYIEYLFCDFVVWVINKLIQYNNILNDQFMTCLCSLNFLKMVN